jgi:hypothetical protein
VLSATKELESGARAMVILAEGLFRLDVAVRGDTLSTVVRNLSRGELAMESPGGGDASGGGTGFGDVAPLEPGIARLGFTLGAGADRVRVSATVATVSHRERGTVRVTTRAVVRPAGRGHTPD